MKYSYDNYITHVLDKKLGRNILDEDEFFRWNTYRAIKVTLKVRQKLSHDTFMALTALNARAYLMEGAFIDPDQLWNKYETSCKGFRLNRGLITKMPSKGIEISF